MTSIMEKQRLVPGDPVLIEKIVSYLKAKGIFDEFRHECLADVDTKSSCQNLSQRVDGYTTKFLSTETWNPDLNKNELRNKLRRHIDESGMLAVGADHVVEQVINPKINQLFLPRIIEVVHQYLNEENNKLNKKKESYSDVLNTEKSSAENSEGPANKSKSTKLDPIADILSFSYSKPKQTNPIQNVQTKTIDPSKADRKKDESLHQTKLSESVPRIERKKDEAINPVKVPDIPSKLKKEETSTPIKCPDVAQSTEKRKEECLAIKTEPVESGNEAFSMMPTSQAKSQEDVKETCKIKKDLKTEDTEVCPDTPKKISTDDIKPEKKKDDFKLQSSDSSSHNEENTQNKSLISKSNSLGKNKSDVEKSKKVKSHSVSKIPSNLSESRKPKVKEPSDSSSMKHTTEKHSKLSSKPSKVSSKDQSSPFKSKPIKSEKLEDNSSSSKPTKIEKTENSSSSIKLLKREDSVSKNKSKDIHSKSSSASQASSSKSASINKESSSVKVKSSFDRTEKPKTSKLSDSSIKAKTESSVSIEKGHKSSIQSSSYESSQGSDQERSSTSTSSFKEKQKHFSKHHKKEHGEAKSNDKGNKTPDKKRSQSDSDSGTPKMHKHSKHVTEKQKVSLTIQESAKISSRSNSFGSTSSVSDSPSSSKETSTSTSEETSDNSLKPLKTKKKQVSKEKDYCKRNQDLPPPPPPPPSSDTLAASTSSAEPSSMEDTQSSQESDSDSKISDDESSSESDVENLYSSDTLESTKLGFKLKTPDILNDIYDIFLFSSSSSEFEGYSSTPEKTPPPSKQISDIDVSPVHTSDLSSFDDKLSYSEGSDIDEEKPARRLTIKEAEKLLQEKAELRRLERLKHASPSKSLNDDKKPPSCSHPITSTMPYEGDASPEPKRELRRERKLNPKYASSEYTSIFNSKKTTFITKQMNQNEDKPANILPVTNSNNKRPEVNTLLQKDIPPLKRRTSMVDLDVKKSSDLELNKFSNASTAVQTFLSSSGPTKELEGKGGNENNSKEYIPAPESKGCPNAHDKNHNMFAEIEFQGRIALKIKKSAIKNDNETNKDPQSHGLKRKFEEDINSDAKRTCRRNSAHSGSSESVANENKPFNNKTNNPSVVLTVEPSSKDFFHKQKLNNNGDVLNKIEHVRKNSLTMPNHVNEKQSSD